MTHAKRRARLPQRETDVQKDVKRAYENAGCFVAVFSQGRKTRQTPGIPDLYVFPPKREFLLVMPDRDAPWFHETKAPGGKQSPDQAEWQIRCRKGGVDYVLGGLLAALNQLYQRGLGPEPAFEQLKKLIRPRVRKLA